MEPFDGDRSWSYEQGHMSKHMSKGHMSKHMSKGHMSKHMSKGHMSKQYRMPQIFSYLELCLGHWALNTYKNPSSCILKITTPYPLCIWILCMRVLNAESCPNLLRPCGL